MYLTVKLSVVKETSIYENELSNSLEPMAKEVGIYPYLWEPSTVGISKARDLITPLSDAISKMRADPNYFKQFEGKHGTGTYRDLYFFLHRYLDACRDYPFAKVATWK